MTPLAANNDRAAQRDRVLPVIRDLFKSFNKQELMDKLETVGLPFAPISKPEDLFDDPHLNAGQGLVEVTIPENGEKAKLPAMPFEMGGQRLGIRVDLSKPGAHTAETLKSYGLYGRGHCQDGRGRCCWYSLNSFWRWLREIGLRPFETLTCVRSSG